MSPLRQALADYLAVRRATRYVGHAHSNHGVEAVGSQEGSVPGDIGPPVMPDNDGSIFIERV